MLLGDELGGSGSPWARDKDGLDEDGSSGGEWLFFMVLGVDRIFAGGLGLGAWGWGLGKLVFKAIPGFLCN